MIRLTAPTTADLEKVRQAASVARPTYPASGEFNRFAFDGAVGSSEADFGAAAAVLRRWGMHTGAGVRVEPVPIATGNDVVMWTKAVGLTLVFACRITEVVDTDTTFGFTYATLPGHPAQGIETFTLRQRDGGVRLDIEGESRPALWLHKLSGPIGLRLQRQATERYITSLRAETTSATS